MPSRSSRLASLGLLVLSTLVAVISAAPHSMAHTKRDAQLPECRGSKDESFLSTPGQTQDWVSAKDIDKQDRYELPSYADYKGIEDVIKEAENHLYKNDNQYCAPPQSDEGPASGEGTPNDLEKFLVGNDSSILACHNRYAILLYANRPRGDEPVRIRCKSVGIQIAKESARCFQPFDADKHVRKPASPAQVKEEEERYKAAQIQRKILPNELMRLAQRNTVWGYEPITMSGWSNDKTWGIRAGKLNRDCPPLQDTLSHVSVTPIPPKDQIKAS